MPIPYQVDARQLGMLHRYPDLAGMSDPERRQVLLDLTGQNSSRGLAQAQFELVMAEFEQILWDRVDVGAVPDPRLCRVCARPLQPVGKAGAGACPEGCERRNVVAWQRDYWRRRVVSIGSASSRQAWMLRRYWNMLCEYLPEDRRSHDYLAAIVCHASDPHSASHAERLARIWRSGAIQWSALTATECHKAIEAIKDRLRHAVR